MDELRINIRCDTRQATRELRRFYRALRILRREWWWLRVRLAVRRLARRVGGFWREVRSQDACGRGWD